MNYSHRFYGTSKYIGLIIAFILLLSGCSGPAAPQEKTKITVKFAWFHQVEYAGFYLAISQGFYAKENLDVTLEEGGYNVNAIDNVLAGQAHFGISRSPNMVVAKSEGKDLLAIGTLFRKSPLVALSLKEKGIQTPKDVEGKTIAIENGDPNYIENVQWAALLKKLGVDNSKIKYISRDFTDPIANDLQSGKADLDIGLFATNDLVTAQLREIEVNTIYYSDYDLDFYANVIFGRQQFINDNPDLVQRFVRATMLGYKYAVEHPEEAVAATLPYDSKLDANIQTAQMKAGIPLIDTGDKPIGWMEDSVWKNTANLLLEGGFIPSAIKVQELYTNEFIQP